MGQLLNRLRDFARSQMRASDAELRWAEHTIGADDDELRRIIDELHNEYTESGHSKKNNQSRQTTQQTASAQLPKEIIKAHMVLNVPVGSTIEDMKKAYRALIATWHPDRFASATAKEQQQAHARAHEINSAYVALRNHYDFR
jgi:DnaJ-domain-containing protein 1